MRQAIWMVLAAFTAPAVAQPVSARVTSAADRALLTMLIAREDSREGFLAGDARNRGLSSANPYIRAFTVRGIGRLEQPSTRDTIARLLADGSAEVRASAADALAQSVARPLAAGAAAASRDTLKTAIAAVRDRLATFLTTERDPGARAAALEAVGRLPQGSVDQVRATASLIAPSLSVPGVIERQGAIRGMFFLARKREARAAGAIPQVVTAKMYDMLTDPVPSGLTPTDRFNIAFALWGAVALTDAQSATMLGDREAFVRERGVVNLARSGNPDLVRSLLNQAMKDSAPVVRFRAVSVFAQKLRDRDGCSPLIMMARDSDVTVALGALDALSGCRNDERVADFLSGIASRTVDGGDWHQPAHALVSLSVVAPDRAKTMMPRFEKASNFFVRMYADTAARLMGDTATLFRLSRDAHPNVQASAIAALSRIVGHAADSVYVRALDVDDNQVLMAAAAALKGSRIISRESVGARIQARQLRGYDTDADGNRALIDLYESLGLGQVVETRLGRLPLPTFDDLVALEKATARIEMMDGSVILMRFHPFDAPTNASRFARLARARTFDGLTFHRVAPFFVVQGPSPNANEYSAPDKPFARDELGVSNVRGTVGLSTRGRDTADGQIYINTVDNVWLDHEYTVMATITSGLEAFDRMQEGARIRRITITP